MRRTLFEGFTRSPLTEPPPSADDTALAELAAKVDGAARRRLGRSLSIREVDAGSCNGCELEIHALNNAFYDLERFGLRFVASPRHADVLMVTGPVTKNMREALQRTYNATPDPKWVVAVGDCALDGGIFAESYAVVGGVSSVVPVDLHIRGCPPRPLDLLKGLLALLEWQSGGGPGRNSNLQPSGYERPTLSEKFNENRHFWQRSATFVRAWLRRYIGYLLVEFQSAHGRTWRFEPDCQPDAQTNANCRSVAKWPPPRANCNHQAFSRSNRKGLCWGPAWLPVAHRTRRALGAFGRLSCVQRWPLVT